MTIGAPWANVNIINETSINFSWSESTYCGSFPDGIRRYMYAVFTGVNFDIRVATGTTIASERMVTVTGLTACTEYQFQVGGFSGSGSGSGSVYDYKYSKVPGKGMEYKIVIQWLSSDLPHPLQN